MFRTVLALFVVVALSSVSYAGLFATPIDNASFESATVQKGSFPPHWFAQLNDWYESANDGGAESANPAGNILPPPPDGSHWGLMAKDGWIYQAIGTWEENWTLRFDFVAADTSHRPFEGLTFQLWGGGSTTADPSDAAGDPHINTIGATLLASGSTGDLFPTESGSASLATWVSLNTGNSSSFPGLTAGTSTLWLMIDAEGTGGGASTPHHGIDDLSVTVTEIPEPASMLLMGLGGLMIARRRG